MPEQPKSNPFNLTAQGRWVTYASGDGRFQATAFAMPGPADEGVLHAPHAPRIARFQVVRVGPKGVSWMIGDVPSNVANFDRGYDLRPRSAEDEAVVASFLDVVESAAAAGAYFQR